jgi:cytochrome c oxidase subunit 2
MNAQSALAPAGAHAETIARLWDLFLYVSAAVWVLVMIALLIALLKRRRADCHPEPPTDGEGSPASRAARATGRGSLAVFAAQDDKTATIAVGAATAVTVVILFALLFASILTGRELTGTPPDPLNILLTGRQWWWQIEYSHPDQSKRIVTANELTIPVGVPVKITLRSTDVIHSFWVPNLDGKRDVIPGHDGVVVVTANRPGVYRGQCAEFCGLQHAKMSFWVNALERADYDRWAEAERQTSRSPATRDQRNGQEIFMRSACALCHNIGGTDASGKTGPDLTHFASRRSIAAATLPNRRELLAQWILDPQHVKPGAQMPPTRLNATELDLLLTYLESLR